VYFAVVIRGVQMKLNWYDSTLSDRFKLIEYRDTDNMAKVVQPINYFTNVSIPVFVGNHNARFKIRGRLF
jgi:hypothetical protein